MRRIRSGRVLIQLSSRHVGGTALVGTFDHLMVPSFIGEDG